MNRFLLDTNILLAYLRGHPLYQRVETEQILSAQDALVFISVVTKAELIALGICNNWGTKKLNLLSSRLSNLPIIDIHEADRKLIQAYADIDAYSRRKLSSKPLPSSARTMGKNDLWIAATAHVTNSTLITTDGDFDHLDGVFFKLVKYTF